MRAGTIPTWKYLAYAAAIATEIVAVTAAIVVGSGFDRLFTGLLLGVTLGVPLGWALRRMDSVDLTDDGIVRHSLLRTRRIGWDRVVGGRFAYDDRERWTLALDLTGGDEPNNELVLLSIQPVTRPVVNPYEMRKREQVGELRDILRDKQVPVTVLPEILDALRTHWGAPPPRRPRDEV